VCVHTIRHKKICTSYNDAVGYSKNIAVMFDYLGSFALPSRKVEWPV